jgi:N-acetylmuramoyl-L-alanine amidase
VFRLRFILAAAVSMPPLSRAAEDSPAAVRPETVVVVDAGHGGRDLGAVIRRRVEKDIDLAIARRLLDAISRLKGFRGVATRPGDRFVPLEDRVEMARKAGGSALVSIHADDARRGRGRGVVIYYFGRFRRSRAGPARVLLPDPPASQVSASRRLAGELFRALHLRGVQVRLIDRGAFAVLKSPDVPSVLVEVGNLREEADARRVCSAGFQEGLALALADGFSRYFEGSAVLAARPRPSR